MTLIRPETADDADQIHKLTDLAFAEAPYSDGTEADIIRRLRADEDLMISLVADRETSLVGHIAFSPLASPDHRGWACLGPVSVQPDLQGHGIGRRLIEEGLALLRDHEVKGCVLLGSPELYGRFGFRSTGSITHGDLPVEYLQYLSFDGSEPKGEVAFAPAFSPATEEASEP